MKRGSRTYVEVEVDIDEFDDEVILEAARKLGFSPFLAEEDYVEELVDAILRGEPHDALRCLRDLLSGNATLLHRVDIASTRKVHS